MDDRTTLPDPVAGTLPSWGDAPTSRAPGWVYIDESVYREELERFFYRGHWCYVGLECEVPDAGDFKRIKVGERSVIKVRDTDGAVRVVEYRCAHRGVAFCRERARQRQGLHLPLPPVELQPEGRPGGHALVVQIIGEAAARVSDAGRAAAPGVEWPVIVAMRNRLVHAYFDVNTDILWKTVMLSPPALLQQLEAVEGVASTDPLEG